MKLLTSLGTGTYKQAEYIWRDYRYKTSLFPLALVEWLHPQEIIVFLTEDAAKHGNWTNYRQQVGDRCPVHGVRIPDGRTEQEIWQIFDIITEEVNEGDTVTIDVTHAFRSLPMVFFAVTAFLRAVKSVKVEHILYGCYVTEDTPAQVIDLTLMLELLDWTEGAKRFTEMGDARLIGNRLVQTQDRLHRQHAANAPKSLKPAGEALKNLTSQIQSNRVLEAMETAESLREKLQSAQDEIKEWAKPFHLLLGETLKQASLIADACSRELSAETLGKQLAMVRQMQDYGMVVQAAELAREWMVNWAIWTSLRASEAEHPDWLEKEVRKNAEDEIFQIAGRPKPETAPRKLLPSLADRLNESTREEFREVWNEIAELRNDLAHCGMKKGAKPGDRIVTRLKKAIAELEQFWRKHQES